MEEVFRICSGKILSDELMLYMVDDKNVEEKKINFQVLEKSVQLQKTA